MIEFLLEWLSDFSSVLSYLIFGDSSTVPSSYLKARYDYPIKQEAWPLVPC